MNIGEKIKLYRKKKFWTQTDLAGFSGISKNSIYNYENNKRNPDIETLEKIAIALDVPISALIDDNSVMDLFAGTGGLINGADNIKNLLENEPKKETLNERLDRLEKLMQSMLKEDINNYNKSKAQLLAPALSIFDFQFNIDNGISPDPDYMPTVIVEIKKENYMKVLTLEEFLEFTENIYNYTEMQINNFKNKY